LDQKTRNILKASASSGQYDEKVLQSIKEAVLSAPDDLEALSALVHINS
jgi:hypothetical protein